MVSQTAFPPIVSDGMNSLLRFELEPRASQNENSDGLCLGPLMYSLCLSFFSCKMGELIMVPVSEDGYKYFTSQCT